MPYRLNFMELGNEERVDTVYASKFEKLATAIWAKDSGVILVVGDFMYKKIIHDPFSFEGGGSGITSLEGQQQILKLAGKYNREVWFDVHVGTEQPVKDNASMAGMLSFSDALDIIAGKVKHKVVVFEYNAGNHAIKRALANAIATLQIERDGRIPVVCSANCLQPDGQNDNDWNQGLLFLNQFQVWLQPPGYVTQMFSRNFQPFNVNCEVNPAPGAWLETNARSSKDGKTLVLEVVNPSGDSISSRIMLDGFNPASKDAVAMVLSGNTEAVNTAERTDNTVPLERKWTHGISNGKTSYTFLPNSFTILRFD
jgi:hypothetical protein